jgi:tetratricopeptide (TPR) repeat protein
MLIAALIKGNTCWHCPALGGNSSAVAGLVLLRKRLWMLLIASLAAVASTGWGQEPEAAAATDIDISQLIFEAEILSSTAEPASTSEAGAEDAASAPAADASTTAAVGDAASNASPATTTVDIRRYQAAIADLQATVGPYSDPLREQYLGLGKQYQLQGEHEKAIASFESAMHIDRVNDGLFTLRQLALVENMIESYAALADFDELNDHEEYLYYIQQKSYDADDQRLLAAKERWADWNVQSFLKEGTVRNYADGIAPTNSVSMGTRNDYVAVQNPNNGNIVYVPRNQMGNVMNSTSITDLYMRSTTYAVPPEMLVDERLRRARDLYEELIESRDADYQASHGVQIEHKVANIAYAIKRQLDSMRSAAEENSLDFNRISAPEPVIPLISSGYTKSRESLEAIISRLEAAPDTDPVELARALINLGDWNMSYERLQRGRGSYEKALAVLTEAGVSADRIDAIFNPSPLIPVPGFALHPYSRSFFGIAAGAALDYDGHIDMTLTLNNNGVIKSPRIIGTSSDTTQQLRSLLLDYLREQRMRPLVQDGKLMKESTLVLRVHYSG